MAKLARSASAQKNLRIFLGGWRRLSPESTMEEDPEPESTVGRPLQRQAMKYHRELIFNRSTREEPHRRWMAPVMTQEFSLTAPSLWWHRRNEEKKKGHKKKEKRSVQDRAVWTEESSNLNYCGDCVENRELHSTYLGWTGSCWAPNSAWEKDLGGPGLNRPFWNFPMASASLGVNTVILQGDSAAASKKRATIEDQMEGLKYSTLISIMCVSLVNICCCVLCWF